MLLILCRDNKSKANVEEKIGVKDEIGRELHKHEPRIGAIFRNNPFVEINLDRDQH